MNSPVQQFSIEELGLKVQESNFGAYGGLTPNEAAYKALKLHPELWLRVRQDEGGGAEPDPESDSRPSGLFGLSKAIRESQKKANLVGIYSPQSLDVAQALANAPGDLLSEVINTFDALRPSNIGSTLESTGQYLEGAGRSAARLIGTREGSLLGSAINQRGGPLMSAVGEGVKQEELDPTEQVFRGGNEVTTDLLLDRNEWIDHPVRNALIATGLMPIPARALGVPSLGALAKSLNPSLNILKAGERARNLGMKGLSIVERERIGVLTGRGGQAVIEAYQAVRRAPKATRDIFYQYARERDSLVNFFGMADAAIRRVRDTRSANFQANFPNVTPAYPIDVLHTNIRTQVRDVLRKRGANVSNNLTVPIDLDNIPWRRFGILDDVDAELIKKWVEDVENPTGLLQGGQVDLVTLDTLRRLAWNTKEHMPKSHNPGQALMGEMYKTVSDELRGGVIGYAEVMDDWKKLTDLIQNFEDAMGIRGDGVMDRAKQRNARVKAVKSAIGALRDNPASEVSATLIRHMEEATGIPILPAAAGALFNNWVGSGIISRAEVAALASLLGGSAAHLAGGSGIAVATVIAALNAPFVSPRVVAEVIMPAAAFTGRHKDALINVFKAIHSKVPDGWDTDGLTYLQAAQRLDEEYRRNGLIPPPFKPLNE